jgi:hypothetical protein
MFIPDGSGCFSIPDPGVRKHWIPDPHPVHKYPYVSLHFSLDENRYSPIFGFKRKNIGHDLTSLSGIVPETSFRIQESRDGRIWLLDLQGSLKSQSNNSVCCCRSLLAKN